MNTYKVLVVDDDTNISTLLRLYLEKEGFEVSTAADGEEALAVFEKVQPDLILLDIMLPKMNGFEVLRSLRSQNINTPIILLTARDDVSDKVKGLDYGADDYLTKPFSKDELLARIRALSRRTGDVILDEICYGDLKLDLNSYSLCCNGKDVRIGHKEFEILKILMANPAQIFSKEDIITKVWGFLSDAEDNNVEVYISFIRKKLQFLKSNVSICTVRKIGYHLDFRKD